MIEELIASAHARGLRVNNLFERDDGTWQANVRRGDGCGDYGKGATAADALRAAIAEMPPESFLD